MCLNLDGRRGSSRSRRLHLSMRLRRWRHASTTDARAPTNCRYAPLNPYSLPPLLEGVLSSCPALVASRSKDTEKKPKGRQSQRIKLSRTLYRNPKLPKICETQEGCGVSQWRTVYQKDSERWPLTSRSHSRFPRDDSEYRLHTQHDAGQLVTILCVWWPNRTVLFLVTTTYWETDFFFSTLFRLFFCTLRFLIRRLELMFRTPLESCDSWSKVQPTWNMCCKCVECVFKFAIIRVPKVVEVEFTSSSRSDFKSRYHFNTT